MLVPRLTSFWDRQGTDTRTHSGDCSIQKTRQDVGNSHKVHMKRLLDMFYIFESEDAGSQMGSYLVEVREAGQAALD